jgi:hypothetical protein
MALPLLSSSAGRTTPASSRIRSSLNLSFRLFLEPFVSPSFSSSSLLNIISGLLVRVVTELAVFRLGDTAGGEVAGTSLSLEELPLESQEKALLIFLAGGGGGGEIRPLLVGDSATGGGDHGMVGRELVMLLKDIDFGGWWPAGFLSSFGGGADSSSRLTLSKDATETCEIRGEVFSSACNTASFGVSTSTCS